MSNWTTQVADKIEQVVVTVRDRTVTPAERAARMIVYGTFAAFCVLTSVFLLAVALFRVLTIPLPVWAAWIVLGGIFIAGGAFLWTRRTRGVSAVGGSSA